MAYADADQEWCRWYLRDRVTGEPLNAETFDLDAHLDLIDIADLETGTNAAYSYALDASANVKQYEIARARVRNAMMWTVRIGFTANWDGTGLRDQIHELAAGFDISGRQR